MKILPALLFCAATLFATLGLSALLYPHSALSTQASLAANTPSPMENFADLDLGEDFGVVSVIDLLGFYIENPPAPDAVQAEPKKQFGGC